VVHEKLPLLQVAYAKRKESAPREYVSVRVPRSWHSDVAALDYKSIWLQVAAASLLR
jgi:hypothetical protein